MFNQVNQQSIPIAYIKPLAYKFVILSYFACFWIARTNNFYGNLQGEFQLRLRQLEKSLLQALNDVKGRILDDDSIITHLETLKTEAREVRTIIIICDSLCMTKWLGWFKSSGGEHEVRDTLLMGCICHTRPSLRLPLQNTCLLVSLVESTKYFSICRVACLCYAQCVCLWLSVKLSWVHLRLTQTIH